MEVKLAEHVYYIVSMMTTTTNSLREFSSSLLKLAKGRTHEDETWYICVLHHFHDNYMFLWWPNIFSHFSSNLVTVARMEMKLGMHAYYIIYMTTSCFHDDRILFEQHQIASGTLHCPNLLTVALIEMKLGTIAYVISIGNVWWDRGCQPHYLKNYK